MSFWDLDHSSWAIWSSHLMCGFYSNCETLCNSIFKSDIKIVIIIITNWTSFKSHSLPEYFCWPCHKWPQCTHLLITASSRIKSHVTKLRSMDLHPLVHLWDTEKPQDIIDGHQLPCQIIWGMSFKSMPQRTEGVLKAKGNPMGTRKVHLINYLSACQKVSKGHTFMFVSETVIMLDWPDPWSRLDMQRLN